MHWECMVWLNVSGKTYEWQLIPQNSFGRRLKEKFVKETWGIYRVFYDSQVQVDQAHMEEMCLKVKELKIRRKSSSKESLLDIAQQRLSKKRGSTETLHTFIEQRGGEGEEEEAEDEDYKKAKYMKKLKQEWIARSLTTLAPR